MQNLDSLKNKINITYISAVSVILLVGLITANLIGSNMLATEGFAVSESETKIIALEKENHELQNKIDESTKLHVLANSADEVGFVSTKDAVYISHPQAFALR